MIGWERDLQHGSPPAPPDGLARLVRRHGDQPRADLCRVAHGVQPPPRDRPRRLEDVVGGLPVADDHVGDPRHGGVVLRDQPAEGDLVARGREPDARLCADRLRPGALRHVR
jgi:hypothetical protein